MAILEYDVRAETGAEWRRVFVWTANGVAVPLGGATALMVVRATIDGPALVTLTDTSGIVLADGSIDVSFTRAQIETARVGFTNTQSPFAWGYTDLILTYSGGLHDVFLSGKFVARKSIGA